MKENIILKNEGLTVTVSTFGAELRSVKDNESGLEYMWQANPEYWARTSPVLFPIVGRLKEDIYNVGDKVYTVGQHGFARDNIFEVIEKSDTKVSFAFCDSEDTRSKFPFKFELIITYTLDGKNLDVKWEVINKDEQIILPFSIGAHPAFNMNLYDALDPSDYYFEFSNEIKMKQWMLTNTGNFTTDYVDLGTSDSLRIHSDLFVHDAIVFDKIDFTSIALRNMKNNRFVKMDVSNFTYKNEQPLIGIWSPYQDGGIAPFVCIEPWFGHADTSDGPFEIHQKPGIIQLDPLDNFVTSYGLLFG